MKKKKRSKEGRLKGRELDNGNVHVNKHEPSIPHHPTVLPARPQRVVIDQQKGTLVFDGSSQPWKGYVSIDGRELHVTTTKEATQTPSLIVIAEYEEFEEALQSIARYGITAERVYEFLLERATFRQRHLDEKFPEIQYEWINMKKGCEWLRLLMERHRIIIASRNGYMKTPKFVIESRHYLGILRDRDGDTFGGVNSLDELDKMARRHERHWPYSFETLQRKINDILDIVKDNPQERVTQKMELLKIKVVAEAINQRKKKDPVPRAQMRILEEGLGKLGELKREELIERLVADGRNKRQLEGLSMDALRMQAGLDDDHGGDNVHAEKNIKKDTSAIDKGFVQRPAKPLKAKASVMFVQHEIEHDDKREKERKIALIEYWQNVRGDCPVDAKNWEIGQIEHRIGDEYDSYVKDKGKKKPKVKYSGKEALADEKYVPTAAELKKARAKATYDDDENPFGQMKA